jgi:hypothetical protein
MKRRGAPEDVPQVIAIVQPTRAFKIPLKKIVRGHLQADSKPLYLEVGNEVLLTTTPSPIAIPVQRSGSRIALPDTVVAELGLEQDTLVAFLERAHAVALKRLDIAEQAGDQAKAVDIETAYRVTRTVYTCPLPDVRLPRLRDQHSELVLHHSVRHFLEGTKTLSAWQAR